MKTIAAMVLATFILVTLIAPAFAQQAPNVAGLEPFSSETNFMSLPGYLRWLLFQTTGQWITYAEAARIVQEQTGR